MPDSKDPNLATLIARLAGQEMLGFAPAGTTGTPALTKVGSGKVGAVKPPPVIPTARD